MTKLKIAVSIGIALCAVPTWAPAQTQMPSEYLGLEVGKDSVLADWSEITRYLQHLASNSQSVAVDTIGRSTLGKPLVMATITSPSNHEEIGRIIADQARLADPRTLGPGALDSIAARQPAVVMINNNIHSTEIASSQFALLFAHELATHPRATAWLDDVVVLLVPSTNPDGLDTVVSWYRQHKGTDYEGGPLPWLYHPYAGHDNNRDWYMLTQVESRAISRQLYLRWYPEVVWDVHQMGSRGPRFFLPPFSDPVNPNLDPILVEATNLVGTAMAAEIYDQGLTGVAHGFAFDLWWHGGFRTVPARHNMIGILSEAASGSLASPIYVSPDSIERDMGTVSYPEEWAGGWWGIEDIIEYERHAARGLLRLLSNDRERFIRRFAELGRRAIDRGRSGNPYAYIIERDQRSPRALAELVSLLRSGGIEIREATASFEASGTEFPERSLVIELAQPFRAHVKDLFDIQVYPMAEDGRPPYDAAGWTLPMQMGIAFETIDSAFSYASRTIDSLDMPEGKVLGSGKFLIVPNRALEASSALVDLLRAGARIGIADRPIEVGNVSVPTGAVVAEVGDLDMEPERIAEAHHLDFYRTARPPSLDGTISRLPRIALYKPWTASMDEGWTRWVLEQHGIPYQTVTDSTIRNGGLGQFDVLLLPSLSARSLTEGRDSQSVPERFAGGLGVSGIERIADFVREGGVLVALAASSELAIDILQLPVTDVTFLDDEPRTSRFFAPGSIFGVNLTGFGPITAGLADSLYVYMRGGRAFSTRGEARSLLTYKNEPLRSGYARNAERVAGQSALVQVAVNEGKVILFGFRPQHRGQTFGTFKVLFNSLLLSNLR